MKKILILVILLVFNVFPVFGYQHPRWSYFPLNVYIEPNAKSEIVRQAFNEWQSASNLAKFRFVDTELKHPNIIIKFSSTNNNISGSKFENAVGLTHSYTPMGFYSKATITIYLTYPGTSKYIKDSELYSIALHEIGHAMGLRHSINPTDIMYHAMIGQSHLTKNDINKLNLIYKP